MKMDQIRLFYNIVLQYKINMGTFFYSEWIGSLHFKVIFFNRPVLFAWYCNCHLLATPGNVRKSRFFMISLKALCLGSH